MSLLELRDLTVRRGSRLVLDRVSLRVGPGEFVGLLGPNGAGKTTLLRAALGLLAAEGRSSLARLTATERAHAVAFLPQTRDVAWPVSVETLIGLGRLPHAGGAAADRVAIAGAMARMGLEGLRARDATGLSGGELARVLLARVLAQETPLVLADEPGAGLDPGQQIRSMQVLAGLAAEGRGVVASIHDLGLAARHCTRLVLLDQGRLVADGAPEAVLDAENLAQVFGIRAWRGQAEGGPVIQPLAVIG